MSQKQSYNHIIPQAIIKNGWGFQSTIAKDLRLFVLDYEKLRTLISNNPSFSKFFIITHINQCYFEINELHPNKDNIIVRRNSNSFMGNKLILNLTEEKLGKISIHINKNIENSIIEATKNNTIATKSLDLIYQWIALQKSRSVTNLMLIYDKFLHQNNLSTISNKKEYLSFKSFYNNIVHSNFDFYYNYYLFNQYASRILNFQKTTGDSCFLNLGTLNTINALEFKKIFEESLTSLIEDGCILQKQHFLQLEFIEISLVSKNQAILIYPSSFNKNDIDTIEKGIVIVWNMFQIQTEYHQLVVKNKIQTYINQMTI